MNVLLISQCDKRALVETRRIVDQFAERRGSRTWQTPITEAGLNTLRGMLKRTARKNTSVACHWVRGLDHTELLWVVGDASRFNATGAVPTNRTERDVLRHKDEHTWTTAEDIKLLATMAALFHDFGKASDAFQAKLRSRSMVADPHRHEWVSLKLLQRFVGTNPDRGWLEILANPEFPIEETGPLALEDGSPFKRVGGLPPLAAAVGWLVVSHHRLPTPMKNDWGPKKLEHLPQTLEHTWASPREDATENEKKACASFAHGIPFASRDWRQRAAGLAKQILARPSLMEAPESMLRDAFAMNIGRLSLVLADHHYSGLPSNPKYGDADCPLHANTDRTTGALKQRLDEHLIGVASNTRGVMNALLRIDRELPRIARHRGFKRRTSNSRFRWQDQAFDLANGLASASEQRGFFGVNMASTGCGKTLANARILYGLSDPLQGARFTIALGLRTLTLQTGDAYRSRLGLGSDDLAVMVGGAEHERVA